MAKLLTSVLTPSGSESCSSDASVGSREALWEEGVSDFRGGSGGYAISFNAVEQSKPRPSRGRARPASRLLGSGYHAGALSRTLRSPEVTGAGAALELRTLVEARSSFGRPRPTLRLPQQPGCQLGQAGDGHCAEFAHPPSRRRSLRCDLRNEEWERRRRVRRG